MEGYSYTDDSKLIHDLRWRIYEELFKPFPKWAVMNNGIDLLCTLTEVKEEGIEEEEEREDN